MPIGQISIHYPSTAPHFRRDRYHTPLGYLGQCFSNILYRTTHQGCKGSYYGLPVGMTRKEFYDWALNHPDYQRLWLVWAQSGYQRALAPSIDRIESTQGYVFGNLQWLTTLENIHKGGRRTCQTPEERREARRASFARYWAKRGKAARTARRARRKAATEAA